MFKRFVSFRGVRLLLAAIAMVAANSYLDGQRTKCSGAFQVTLIDGQNLLGLKVVSNCCLPGVIPGGLGFLESLRIQPEAFEVGYCTVDRLLRWSGSATILGLIAISLKPDQSDGTK